MNEKISLDALTQNHVVLKKQKYVSSDGIDYPIGEPWSKSYSNSITGRNQVQSEIEEPYKTAIFAVWGDSPTVIEEPNNPT